MSNREVWEREYNEFKLLVKAREARPTSDFVRFLRWLKKTEGWEAAGQKVLDLGSGTGRNAIYLASLGAEVVGLELASGALELAQARAAADKLEFLRHDIGAPYPFPDAHFDLALDVTSSNSLTEKEREIHLAETRRVLRPGGWFFVRALCKDGDKNAQNLLKKFPGPEPDTYVMPELGLTERVFGEVDFRALYGRYFSLEKLIKKETHTLFNGRAYRRRFWLAYFKR
jgi:SAM-dependent methyltransferase